MIGKRLGDERGWVLVSATVLTLLMLSIGLAAAGLIDNEQRRTREQRERESALNLDEGVLYAQSLVMANAWPSAPDIDPLTGEPGYYPVKCTSSGAADKRCPNPNTLAAANSSTPSAAAFSNVDQLKNVTWYTKVRDDGDLLASSYNPADADKPQTTKCFASAPCTYDANGNHELWVQSLAFVHGKPRNVVARLRMETLTENIPKTAVVAGALQITNSGLHGGGSNNTPIIDAADSQVIVRCADVTDETCAKFDTNQIKPSTPESKDVAPLMTPEQLQRFKQRAVTDRKYFSGCPGKSDNLAGKVVWVEGCLTPPTLGNTLPTVSCPTAPAGMSQSCINTEDNPGILIWHCGRADFQGGITFRGVLYMANNSDGTCDKALFPHQIGNGKCSTNPSVKDDQDILNTNGGFGVWGAAAVDGPACLKLGSNGLQVRYDSRVFEASQSYGTVGLVQNTWRELDPQTPAKF